MNGMPNYANKIYKVKIINNTPFICTSFKFVLVCRNSTDSIVYYCKFLFTS